MEESFILPVNYKGTTHDFEARLILTGYTYKFEVSVNGVPMFFEPDEEGLYRAMVPEADFKTTHSADPALLQAVAQAIETVLA